MIDTSEAGTESRTKVRNEVHQKKKEFKKKSTKKKKISLRDCDFKISSCQFLILATFFWNTGTSVGSARIYKINIRISHLHRPQLLLPCHRPREINRINSFLSYLFSKIQNFTCVDRDTKKLVAPFFKLMLRVTN